MRKGIKILVVVTLVIFALQPITQSINYSEDKIKTKSTSAGTLNAVCYVIDGDENYEKCIKEITREDYNLIMEMGRFLFKDFLTIYNPDSTKEEVDIAIDNVRPFFTAIVDKEFTDKSVDELELLYRDIREKIKKGSLKRGGKIQSTGWWNGIWAPAFVNGGCGIFAEAKRCQGFVIGTHSIFPSIGADILLTYFTTDLTAITGTIGVTGVTDANGPQMAFIINYIGIREIIQVVYVPGKILNVVTK